MYAKTLWTKGVIDGNDAQHFGFVFYGLRNSGLDTSLCDLCFLFYVSTTTKGEVNVQHVRRIFLGLHVAVWIYVLDKRCDFCWYGNQAQSRKKGKDFL